MPTPTEQPCPKVGMFFSDCPHRLVHVAKEIGEKFPDHPYSKCEPTTWFHSDELDEQPPNHGLHTEQKIQVRTTKVFEESDFPYGPFV